MKKNSASSSGSLNGKGTRKNSSWIEAFVDSTENLEAPKLFRRWAAIVTLATTLEQRIWLTTSSPIYPNLYVFLIGHPGTGKTRTIRKAREYVKELPEPHIAPISLTWASLVDALVRNKRMIIRLPEPPLDYNSMLVAPDELGAFIHKWDNEMIDGLSALYDPDEYGQERRGGDIKIKIKSPQLNILSGATPARLMELMPESAWGQGFTSRSIMVFSDERFIIDDFAGQASPIEPGLVNDLKLISMLCGEYRVTEEYRKLILQWREEGENPQPQHPKLTHYNTRRKMQIYKLSLIAAADKSGAPVLTAEDFHRAKGWLEEAEVFMPDIFKAGGGGAESQVMDEIYHFVLTYGKTVPETKLINFMRERVPAHSVSRVLEIMMRADMIKPVTFNKATGMRDWQAIVAPPDAEIPTTEE